MWFGGTGWWLSGALVLYVAHTLRNLALLDRVLDGHKRATVRHARLWAEIFARRQDPRGAIGKYTACSARSASTGAGDSGIILIPSTRSSGSIRRPRLLELDPTVDIGNRLDNLLRHPDSRPTSRRQPARASRSVAERGGRAGSRCRSFRTVGPASRDRAGHPREIQLERTRHGRRERLATALAAHGYQQLSRSLGDDEKYEGNARAGGRMQRQAVG